MNKSRGSFYNLLSLLELERKLSQSLLSGNQSQVVTSVVGFISLVLDAALTCHVQVQGGDSEKPSAPGFIKGLH